MLLIIIWYFFHNYFWPQPWPQPPEIGLGLGLGLEVLASFNITVIIYRRLSFANGQHQSVTSSEHLLAGLPRGRSSFTIPNITVFTIRC